MQSSISGRLQCALLAVLYSAVLGLVGCCSGIANAQAGERLDRREPTIEARPDRIERVRDAGRTWRETFEEAANERWLLLGGARIDSGSEGKHLACSGWGVGVWKTDPLTDLSLRLRYRHADGIGDIVLRGVPTNPPEHLYHIGLTNDRIVIGREFKQKLTELESAPYTLKPGAWYEIAIALRGGQIVVAMNEQEVLTATDPDPLAPGLVGFGALAGNGFAFDDAVLAARGPTGQDQPVGVEKGTPADKPKLVEPVVGPIPKGQNLMQHLAAAEVRSMDDLVVRVATPQGLADVSLRSQLPPGTVLAAAQRSEMARVIAPAGIGDDYVLLLSRLGFKRPEHLKAYSGREDTLTEIIAAAAVQAGIAAPGKHEVANWVKGASSGSSRLPEARALLPRTEIPAEMLRPARPISIAHWNPQKPEAVKMLQLGPVHTAALLPAALGATTDFTLKQGQKTILKDFAAPAPGLYRADVSFARKGGHVTLEWRVEKPAGAPVVQGGKAMTLEDIVKGKSDYYVFFWLTGQDIAESNQMRFHIEVSRNDDYKMPPKPKDTIEQGPGDPPVTDPTITGTLNVVRQAPITIAQIGEADVPILNKPNPNQINYPIQYLEMPAYKPVSRPPAVQFPLKLTMIPDPNTFREPYVENGITKQDEGIVWVNGVQVICDDTIVTAGKTTSIKGITGYQLGSPTAGTYRVIGTPGDTLSDLMNTGAVYEQNTEWFRPVKRIVVRSELDGGKVREAYVAELWRLEVSHQSEPGDDGNDTGLGEFKLECNTVLARTPADQTEWKQLDQASTEWMKKYPPVVMRTAYPQSRYINVPGYGPCACYPGKMLSYWSEDDLKPGNYSLNVLTTVVEDDELTWWQEFGAAIQIMAKAIVGIVKLAFSGDASGMVGVFKDCIETSLQTQAMGIQQVDDVMGYTLFTSTREQGFGLLKPGDAGCSQDALFLAEGNGRLELIDTSSCPPPVNASKSPGWATRKVGSIQPWAGTNIAVRTVTVPWSRRFRVQLDEFQLTYDFAAAQARGDDPSQSWWPLHVYALHGKGTLGMIDVYRKGQDYETQISKASLPPVTVGDLPDQWKRTPAHYFEIPLWEERPDSDDFVGIVSMTAYPQDFLKYAAANSQAAKPLPLDQAAKDALDRGDIAAVKEHSHVIFYKQGADYVAEYTIYDPGYHLEYVKFKLFLEIWDQ